MFSGRDFPPESLTRQLFSVAFMGSDTGADKKFPRKPMALRYDDPLSLTDF